MTAHGGLIRRPDGIPVRLTISPAGVWYVDMRLLFSNLPHMVTGADAHAEAPPHPSDEPHDPISSANMPLTCALGHASRTAMTSSSYIGARVTLLITYYSRSVVWSAMLWPVASVVMLVN